MKINFLQGKLDNITFYVMPDAKFIPPLDLKEDERQLKGFKWRAAERPTKIAVKGRKRLEPKVKPVKNPPQG